MQQQSEKRVLAAVENIVGKATAEMELTIGKAKVEMESAFEKTKAEIVLSQCRLEGKITQEIAQIKNTNSGGMNRAE